MTRGVVFFLAVCCATLARVASVPCSPGLVSLVVEDSAGASALATATNCTGGAFDVKWMGHVEFPETIYVADGTVLNITGADGDAVADGTATTQFLNIADAAVHLSGMRIERCTADFGGAVFAHASVLTFDATKFVGNTATEEGGALYVGESNVSWSRETTLSANSASGEEGRGGAIFADKSSVSWSGETNFSSNTASGASGSGGGGAIFAAGSIVHWSGETSFAGNTANYTSVGGTVGGGALAAIESSEVFWDGETSFFGNTADGESPFGGALFMVESTLYWNAATSFSGNAASVELQEFGGEGEIIGYGGALYTSDSNVSWSVETNFSDNVAGGTFMFGLGGAISARNGSIVSWSGETKFSNNAALCVNSTCELGQRGLGGALAVEFSDVSWSGETSFSDNLAVGYFGQGGALYLYDSNVSWIAETTFSANTATGEETGLGGAISSYSSGVSWSADTTFLDNIGSFGAALLLNETNAWWSAETSFSSNVGGWSGALGIYYGSSVSWSAATSFFNNTGAWGGAFRLVSASVSWSGETVFSNNAAEIDGGAVDMARASSMSWSGETTFSDNAASEGGALAIDTGSDVSWTAKTTFSGNVALENDMGGGAIRVADQSIVSWSGETNFSSNSASSSSGGALFVSSSTVSWSEVTSFSHNSARLDGGAVFVEASFDGTEPSSVSWNAETTFLDNSCARSGGAMALVGDVYPSAGKAVFEGNTATSSGGAVFMSEVGVGPVFVEAIFTVNVSPQGGAVYTVSSGTELDGEVEHPTTYDGCFFAGNRASITGGAIESVAGNDAFKDCAFERNMASVGGALRLSGSTSLNNCDFVDNVSDEDGAAAISNAGALSISEATFAGNDFWCENGTYVDSVDGDRWSKVCDGCGGCPGCEMEEPNSAPICSSQLEHTRSEGGDTTVETLQVDAGYWRATSTSPDVLACYNEDACLGGVTGSPGYCEEGYEGPYCSVCSEEHTRTLSFTCTECVDSRGAIAIMTAVAVFGLCAIIVLFVHLVSGEKDGSREGIVHRVTKLLPLQSIKIVVVVWQILTQFTSVANVTYPDVYARFLDSVDVFNLDALWIPSAGCVMDVDFHDRLLVSTIGPLVALALLAATFTVATRRNRGSEPALEIVRHKHMSMVLLISFLVYSSVSATIFQVFACEPLSDQKTYLRADYSIECDSSKHQAFQVFAGVMIFVYPLGIPLFYAYLLYKNRHVLASENDEEPRETSSKVQPISDLWVPYKPGRFYYEVIECVRRIMLTGVVVFIYPDTAAQVAVTLMIAVVFLVVSVLLAPFVSKWDASLSLIGHGVIFTSVYVALLSKVDVADERDASQEVFAGILVAAHACMIVAVVVETAVIYCSMGLQWGPQQREGPRRKVHGTPVVPCPEDPAVSS